MVNKKDNSPETPGGKWPSNNLDADIRSPSVAPPLLVTFLAGDAGAWRIDSIKPVVGSSLGLAPRLAVIEGRAEPSDPHAKWALHGSTSNLRYTVRAEAKGLLDRQEGLNRPAATLAALIPVRKTQAWWALAQDERRAIFEEQSRHIVLGMQYLPAVARRLHHSRELGEPFDFLTWFEYTPESSEQFEQLVRALRATLEWQFVDREIDIRLSRAPDG
jgi:hypothetical protein